MYESLQEKVICRLANTFTNAVSFITISSQRTSVLIKKDATNYAILACVCPRAPSEKKGTVGTCHPSPFWNRLTTIMILSVLESSYMRWWPSCRCPSKVVAGVDSARIRYIPLSFLKVVVWPTTDTVLQDTDLLGNKGMDCTLLLSAMSCCPPIQQIDPPALISIPTIREFGSISKWMMSLLPMYIKMKWTLWSSVLLPIRHQVQRFYPMYVLLGRSKEVEMRRYVL